MWPDKSSIPHTVLVHNKSEGLIGIAVDTVRALSNIVHELRGRSGGFAVEGDGNGRGPQEFEQRMSFVDSEELLVNVIPLGPPQPPRVRGNREDVGRLGGELTLSRGPEKRVEYLQPLEPLCESTVR